jgi:molybdenum cofactor synthesis domain-containing protein
MDFSAAVVTVSDAVSSGTREDSSGPRASGLLKAAGFYLAAEVVVPDEVDEISAALIGLCDRPVDLVLTTGGTGFAERDVTPEATRRVIEKEAPGLGELMRAAGLRHTPMAALSRAVAGSRGGTLIVNLPGSPKGVEESLTAVIDIVPHALRLLRGDTTHHPESDPKK